MPVPVYKAHSTGIEGKSVLTATNAMPKRLARCAQCAALESSQLFPNACSWCVIVLLLRRVLVGLSRCVLMTLLRIVGMLLLWLVLVTFAGIVTMPI